MAQELVCSCERSRKNALSVIQDTRTKLILVFVSTNNLNRSTGCEVNCVNVFPTRGVFFQFHYCCKVPRLWTRKYVFVLPRIVVFLTGECHWSAKMLLLPSLFLYWPTTQSNLQTLSFSFFFLNFRNPTWLSSCYRGAKRLAREFHQSPLIPSVA